MAFPVPSPTHIARVAALLACSLPALAQAGGFNNPDTGLRRNGMLAVTGRVGDTSAIMHNVADFADQRGNRVMVSGMAAFLGMEVALKCEPWMDSYDRLHECETGDGTPREYTSYFEPERSFGVSPFLGGSVDLSPWVDRLTVAAAVYAPNFMGAFLDDQSIARFFGIDTFFVTAMATAAVAWRPIDELAIGVGGSYMYVLFNQSKRMDVLGMQEFHVKMDGTEHSGMLSLGAILDPVDWLSIGAAFNSAAHLVVEGDVDIRTVSMDTQDGERGLYPDEESYLTLRHKTRMLVPWKLMLGFNLHPTDWLEVGADYYHWHYADFKEQQTRITGIHKPDSTPQFFADQVAAMDFDSPRHFRNSNAFNVGARVRATFVPVPLWLMGSYQYDWGPGNKKYITFDSPYLNLWGFGLGVDVEPTPWLRVAVGWIRNVIDDYDITESEQLPPANGRAQTVNNELSLGIQVTL